jgi:nucleoid-associated protein YgaU
MFAAGAPGPTGHDRAAAEPTGRTMAGAGRSEGDRVITPAVTAAAIFVAIAALGSMTFVSARGGLQLPVAATGTPGVALASPAAVGSPAGQSSPSTVPTPPAASAVPSASPSASPPATPPPSAAPSPTAAPTGRPDPLAALPACPDHPGCYEYTVRRGDSYTAINDRFGLLLWITDALNPEVADKGVIVVGQTLYLGRDPEARLDPCPDGAACRLYVVRSGDTLSAIAGRFGITVAGIEALNPGLDPNALGPGRVISLPLYQG